MNIKEQIKRIINDHSDYERLFISIGYPKVKAVVKSFKLSNKNQMIKFIETYRKKSGKAAKWIKIDIVTSVEDIPFDELKEDLIHTTRNHVEYGFTLDYNWNLAFLPEEINSNAFIRPTNEKGIFILSEKNINHYLRKYKKNYNLYLHKDYAGKVVQKFYTKSFYIEDEQVINLEQEGYKKGLRPVDNLPVEIDRMIQTNTDYLMNLIQDNGKYHYGYFPHFDININAYNNLCHSSTTYAFIKSLSYLKKNVSIAKKPIDYIIKHYLYKHEGATYVFDDTNYINEIKLGQNAAFILAVCSYIQYGRSNKKYLKAAQNVAKGLVNMIDENGETTHVLNYPDLTVKDSFRVIYYEGQAALALLKLYQLDQKEEWLNVAKLLYEKFIRKSYWKHHDYWLSYSTEVLIQVEPEEKYYQFAFQNLGEHLNNVQQRQSTDPLLLGMLMATYNIVESAKQRDKTDLVEQFIDVDLLIDTIHRRADYMRTGYFYPEVAMYFQNPERILEAFYIKHEGYRVEIDDIEHYLTSYVEYLKVFNQ